MQNPLPTLSDRAYSGISLVLFLGLSVLFFRAFFFEITLPVHQWAQADRLAIAFKFYESNFNFFVPRSYSMTSIDGIIGVELQWVSYLSALLGLVFGKSAIPFIFKSLTLGCWIVAQLFVQRLMLQKTQRFALSLLLPLFLWTSPLLVYYAFSYLPDIAALSVFLIGMTYFARLIEKPDLRQARRVLWICTFAALTKLMLAFYLPIIVLASAFFLYRKNPPAATSTLFRYGLHVLLAMAVLIGYFFYIKYLQNMSESYIFLSEARPYEGSFSELMKYLHKVFMMHQRQYLSQPVYTLLIIWVLFALITWGRSFRKRTPLALLLLGFMVAGSLGIYLLSAQFWIHDYYAINAAFPSVILAVALGVLGLTDLLQKAPELWKNLISLLGVLATVYMIFPTYSTYLDRATNLNRVRKPQAWLLEAKIPHEQIAFPDKAKVLVNRGEAPNLALVYFQQDGVIQETSHPLTVVHKMIGEEFEYLIVSEGEAKRLQQKAPCIMEYLDMHHQGNNYRVYRLKSFLGWEKEENETGIKLSSDFEAILPCDTLPVPVAHSGERADVLSQNRVYGYNLKVPFYRLGLSEGKSYRLEGKVWLRSESETLSDSSGSPVYLWVFEDDYRSTHNRKLYSTFFKPRKHAPWQAFSFSCSLPKNRDPNNWFSLFFSFPNEGGEQVLVDDLEVQLIKEEEGKE
jgi:hypothetical protein